jgi:hypothetical protein
MAQKFFEQWMKEVDAEIFRRCGMTSADIDDWRYADDFDDRMSPARTAVRAIKNAKEACGM